MPNRVDTTPLLVRPPAEVEPLVPVPYGERGYDEDWLQKLIFHHPAVIPVTELEPVFAPLIAVARELPTDAGPLDVLCISPDGYPTLIETKLWRNPEARRQVVAQAIDYATQMSRWSYDDLNAAIRAARPDVTGADPLLEIVTAGSEAVDERQFIDTVARNLQRGRMLLLIVGDGIRESVEQMADALTGAPHLGFTLGLIELALYRLPGATGDLLVQPRMVMRTREVVRAVVEVRGAVRLEDVEVRLPEPTEQETSKRRSLTEEEFYVRLAQEVGGQPAQALRDFVDGLRDLGVEIVGRQASLSLHYRDHQDNRFSFGSVGTNGAVDFYFVNHFVVQAGLSEQIAKDYLNALAAQLPGARVDLRVTQSGGRTSAIKLGGRHVTIVEVLPHAAVWRAAIESMIDAIDRAARESA